MKDLINAEIERRLKRLLAALIFIFSLGILLGVFVGKSCSTEKPKTERAQVQEAGQ